jgi:hypothetical protein
VRIACRSGPRSGIMRRWKPSQFSPPKNRQLAAKISDWAQTGLPNPGSAAGRIVALWNAKYTCDKAVAICNKSGK